MIHGVGFDLVRMFTMGHVLPRAPSKNELWLKKKGKRVETKGTR